MPKNKKDTDWSLKMLMDDGGGRHRPFFDPRMALYDNMETGVTALNYDKDNLTDPLARMYSKAQYGAADQIEYTLPKAHGRGMRQSLNRLAIGLAILVPFVFFMGTFNIMSFELYDKHPSLALLCISGFFFATLVIGAMAVQAQRTQMNEGQNDTWHVFIFLTCLLACCLGTTVGYVNRQLNSKWYYQYINLRKVVGVEPGKYSGQQLLDAGEIDFVPGVGVNTGLQSFYQHNKAYCVAPIVPADGYNLASYDLWAVGENCCSAVMNSFSCGTDQGAATGGLRVIKPDEVMHYRLAVEQAAVQHNLQYRHPIFLHLEQKPYKTIRAYMDYARYVAGAVGLFILAALSALVGFQAVAFGGDVPSGFREDSDTTHKAQVSMMNPGMHH